jgi:hypothetical protein
MAQIRVLLTAAVGLSIAFSLAAPAAAQSDYPNRPIRMIIPFPAGGSNDIVGRAIAAQMSERLGKQIVIDNRSGAGGAVGTEAASKLPNDGYNILVISIAHSVNPWLYKLPYDPIKAFTPIGIMGTGTNVLTVHPTLPVNTLKEFLELAKSKPGEVSYASAGVGTFQHLGAELFQLESKVKLMHVPFRGGGPALVDVLGGHNKVLFSSLVQARPVARARHRRCGANACASGIPDHLGSGPSRLRGAELVGPDRARGRAAGDHRQAARGAGEGAGLAGNPGAVREGRRRHPQDEHGGIRGVHRERNEEMGARGEGSRDQGGITVRSFPNH